ncbi:hypothetical protein BCR37DRAFT_376909 [Protomyces lactucae-debilis]|uniref:Uncharacterized protein n=1 Tax=Protomyces lactucae-debilis TaxID=2754530 RepID=A0A1Y2FRX6_PROLT|nr:uncharacterized protein BCR37DRAFT_376909 [Protomyces lactucae-debilis]ORY86337.1 hypothetical protein BCR37DRAFT_376909 [Protomyces lactucae-debilis]
MTRPKGFRALLSVSTIPQRLHQALSDFRIFRYPMGQHLCVAQNTYLKDARVQQSSNKSQGEMEKDRGEDILITRYSLKGSFLLPEAFLRDARISPVRPEL